MILSLASGTCAASGRNADIHRSLTVSAPFLIGAATVRERLYRCSFAS
jgi:hypothetical protein